MPGHVQAIPDSFCWTRFGTEAGETIEAILERKEQERQHNDGMFFWGIGNSVAPGLMALLERYERPEVLFSPIKARPRLVDRAPAEVITWRGGRTLDGRDFALPATAKVTSGRSAQRSTSHYALVCASQHPLTISDDGAHIDFLALRNLASGNPLGASQVTAVVHRDSGLAGGRKYVVAFRAVLTPPYFLRLDEPAHLTPAAPLAA